MTKLSDVDIHAIDLPGFGVSSISNSMDTDATISLIDKMEGLSTIEIVDFYCDILRQYILTNMKHKEKIILVGHSFGSFLCIHFASRYPQFLQKLVLVNPGGIFPVYGAYANYWAIFFKLNLPQSLLIKAKQSGWMDFLHSLVNYNIKVKEDNLFAHYYLELLSCENGFSSKYIGKFIDLGFIRCQWKDPCIVELLNILFFEKENIPIRFIYGEDDSIMPYLQGRTICDSDLQNICDIACDPVSQASHAPYFDNLDEFCNVMRRILISKEESRKKGTFSMKRKLDIDILRRNLLDQCFSTFCVKNAEKMIEKQYAIFREFVGGLFYP